jgi:membrane-bound serine protease (ClpP class)
MDLTFLTDPNIVYVALIIGLWAAVTTAHIPGTGFIEVAAVIALGGAAMLLLNMPTNWSAVFLIIVGVIGFIIIPFLKRQYTTLSLGGLVLQAAGGYWLFHGETVSPFVIGITIALSLVYHYFMLLPALRQLSNAETASTEETVIGAVGRVVKALDPVGTVQVNSELWTATSDQPLPAGEQVIIVSRDGLQLFVERAKRKYLPQNGNSEPVEIT